MVDNNRALKLPPQSLEAEQAVLGCMLIDPEAVAKTLHILTEKSFFNTAHAYVFSAISNGKHRSDTNKRVLRVQIPISKSQCGTVLKFTLVCNENYPHF